MKKAFLAVLFVALFFTGCSGPKNEVRWFVGLGAGSDEPTIKAQQAIVDEFNEKNNDFKLVLEVVPNAQAYQTLATQFSGGNAPDVVGPVGIRGRDSFKGSWLDLEPLVKKNGFDLSMYDSSMIDFYRDPDEGLLGIPFAIYPSFLYVNEELFEEAGLPLPPKHYGEPYVDDKGVKHEWNFDTIKWLGMRLTVDENGNDATSPDFDPEKIAQWGFAIQWTDARGVGTLFGPGSFVAKDGSATIPSQWKEGWKWYYDAMWKDHFVPTAPQANSDILKNGDLFASGRVAMVHCHLWYAGFAQLPFKWNPYPVPSYKGKTTAKMHADTFLITKATKNPDAAFKVLTYLVDDKAEQLAAVYGGMPAKKSLQDTFLTKFFTEKFPDFDIDYGPIVESIKYPDNPNHESWMPSFQEANQRYNQFWDEVSNKPDLDFDAAVESLENDLDGIFKAASK
ncbi:extracellular solute-binding protein [Spirochaetia bacterium 38H-sp]|uniref:sn-glycerol-3-phosphate-binding periplasmic protein UgpB n=1 Tax=Rarispira pelagica TaxID=3141764 RepID=A0ABU9UCY1_9SPIR